MLFCDNPEQVKLLHDVFGPFIQHSLSVFKQSWNKHHVSKFGVPERKYFQNKKIVEVLHEPLSIEEFVIILFIIYIYSVITSYQNEGGSLTSIPLQSNFLFNGNDTLQKFLEIGDITPFIDYYCNCQKNKNIQ